MIVEKWRSANQECISSLTRKFYKYSFKVADALRLKQSGSDGKANGGLLDVLRLLFGCRKSLVDEHANYASFRKKLSQ
ncbi:MAG TPA: hypothetical protein VK653_02825 [Xanthobacteraceae bacterium]|nr:hypothetical protein [Xanthobacteraceae bacterium]